MKRYIIFVVLGTALLAACGGLTGGSFTAMHASAIRDSVQTTLDTFRRYSAAGQWDSLADLYANDADFRFLDQGMVQYRSPGEIRNALRRVAPGRRGRHGLSHQVRRTRESEQGIRWRARPRAGAS